ncbi:winged helix-turn-helix domain-containing protein [Paenactinomyces guangxiensis]|uniref:Winged helix-turn-helix domain-containing protein n=1 Tax=Paenactinomyces guangxiensis TaxID=1490290 RepID=A0A7W1WRG9_9BACL|nr:winged helix-turn-helix domain-containing protein [Paenactinomyces guangxiensis]MBA4494727.1 winged helix-turn-helix domain-containing protein [Paenactinomyces guangxiensis]MBH8591811.1 winged helix-turn-helix domain-containing protein [Paenactinomyces guangxiensis]
MFPIKLNPDEQCMEYRSKKIYLLPKEFSLLEFFFQYPGKTFSRSQLLDQVWKMDAPVDRTVDDHVYRIRKKIKELDGVLRIETVRGRGYRLMINLVPAVYESEMTGHIYELWKKYHRDGRGKSLQVLAENQKELGFHLTFPYLGFIKGCLGDFEWFLTNDEIPLGERIYYLCYGHYITEFNPEKTLFYFHNAMEKKLLPDLFQLEVEIHTVIEIMLDAGEISEALSRFDSIHKTVKQYGLSDFVILVALTECRGLMLAGEWEKAEKQLRQIKEKLTKTPYLRELGYYHLLKGIFSIYSGKTEEGKWLIDQGWDIMQETHMAANMLLFLHHILFQSARLINIAEIETKYHKIWDQLLLKYKLKGRGREVELFLDKHLL